jgi:hypothetical protein
MDRMNKETLENWLLGFVAACGENPPTKEQWMTLVEAVKSLHKRDWVIHPPTWTYTGTQWTYTGTQNVNHTSKEEKKILND